MGLVWVLAADRELRDAGLGGCTWVQALGVTKLGSIPILGSAGCVRCLPMSQWCALTENIFKRVYSSPTAALFQALQDECYAQMCPCPSCTLTKLFWESVSRKLGPALIATHWAGKLLMEIMSLPHQFLDSLLMLLIPSCCLRELIV